MSYLSEEFWDRAAGYVALCQICDKLLYVRPPRLSWLMDIIATDEFEAYLLSQGYEILPDDDDVYITRPPRKFADIEPFDRSKGPPAELVGKTLRVRRTMNK